MASFYHWENGVTLTLDKRPITAGLWQLEKIFEKTSTWMQDSTDNKTDRQTTNNAIRKSEFSTQVGLNSHLLMVLFYTILRKIHYTRTRFYKYKNKSQRNNIKYYVYISLFISKGFIWRFSTDSLSYMNIWTRQKSPESCIATLHSLPFQKRFHKEFFFFKYKQFNIYRLLKQCVKFQRLLHFKDDILHSAFCICGIMEF